MVSRSRMLVAKEEPGTDMLSEYDICYSNRGILSTLADDTSFPSSGRSSQGGWAQAERWANWSRRRAYGASSARRADAGARHAAAPAGRAESTGRSAGCRSSFACSRRRGTGWACGSSTGRRSATTSTSSSNPRVSGRSRAVCKACVSASRSASIVPSSDVEGCSPIDITGLRSGRRGRYGTRSRTCSSTSATTPRRAARGRRPGSMRAPRVPASRDGRPRVLRQQVRGAPRSCPPRRGCFMPAGSGMASSIPAKFPAIAHRKKRGPCAACPPRADPAGSSPAGHVSPPCLAPSRPRAARRPPHRPLQIIPSSSLPRRARHGPHATR